MARDSTGEASWEEAFRWQRPQRPEEPGVRDVAVDPFSLRQFACVDIDRPLPIPSVSVDDRRVSPARFHGASVVPPAGSASSSLSTRASTAGGLKPPAAPAWWEWDGAGARPIAPSGALPRSKLSAGGDETEVPGAGFDVALSSTELNKASEPQRWGSDVPLIVAAADAEEYSFGGKDGLGKQAKHAAKAPFTCCMFVPGLARRIKPPTPTSTATVAARYSSSGKSGKSATVQLQPINPGTCSARPSTMSLAVSLERFDCGGLSTSSSPRAGLGIDDGDGEAASASSHFDLPLELILGCGAEDDTDLPVCAAFLFDSDGIRKSVLKRGLEAGAGWEPRRPSLGKVSMDASSWTSNPQVRVSLKSRSP